MLIAIAPPQNSLLPLLLHMAVQYQEAASCRGVRWWVVEVSQCVGVRVVGGGGVTVCGCEGGGW